MKRITMPPDLPTRIISQVALRLEELNRAAKGELTFVGRPKLVHTHSNGRAAVLVGYNKEMVNFDSVHLKKWARVLDHEVYFSIEGSHAGIFANELHVCLGVNKALGYRDLIEVIGEVAKIFDRYPHVPLAEFTAEGVDPAAGPDQPGVVVGTVTGRTKMGPNANGDILPPVPPGHYVTSEPTFIGKLPQKFEDISIGTTADYRETELRLLAQANGLDPAVIRDMARRVESVRKSYEHATFCPEADLSVDELRVYNYMLGRHGRPQLKLSQIAHKFGLTPSHVSRLRKSIKKKMAKLDVPPKVHEDEEDRRLNEALKLAAD